MTVSILHPDQQYLFTNDQMGLIYDLLRAYLDDAKEADEVLLTQETLDCITMQFFDPIPQCE